MESPGKQNEDLGVEEGEVVEPILPPHDGTHHEEPSTAEQDEGEEENDFGVGGGRGVG
jgi:hypothetical protein